MLQMTSHGRIKLTFNLSAEEVMSIACSIWSERRLGPSHTVRLPYIEPEEVPALSPRMLRKRSSTLIMVGAGGEH